MIIEENKNLSGLNTFGVSVKASHYAALRSLEDIRALIDWNRGEQLKPLILGGGSNLLFLEDYQGVVAHINLKGIRVQEDESDWLICAAGGENWHGFVRYCVEQGYAGLENLSLIPGTVGAAPIQNIGAYGVELKDVFESLMTINLQTGQEQSFDVKACQFSYRDSYFKQNTLDNLLISEVTFRLPKKAEFKLDYAGIREQLDSKDASAETISDAVIALRQSKLPDPDKLGNAGSFFKNPVLPEGSWQQLKQAFPSLPGYSQSDTDAVKTSAAWLIDQCGWKGFRQGDAGVSEQHALVLVNYQNASGAELWELAQTIMYSVKDKFDIMLEPEPRVITTHQESL